MKYIKTLIFLSALLILGAPPMAASAASEWTHLVFLDDPSGAAFREINSLELAGTGGKITTVAMWRDRSSGYETTYLIGRDANPGEISSTVLSRRPIPSGEASLSCFSDFVAGAFEKYPSPRLVVTLYARNPIIVGERLSILGDRAPVEDLASSLARICRAIGRRIDVVHFDAHSHQCFELLYEIAPYADYSIGSEELIPPSGTPYNVILDAIASQKEFEPRRFCFAFVSAWHRHFKQQAKAGVRATLSAIVTSELPMVTEKLDIFLESLSSSLAVDEYKKVFCGSVVKKVRRYIEGRMVDAFDLGRLANEEVHDERVEQSSREFLASITNATVKNSAIGDFGKIPVTYNSFGVSCFMPAFAPQLQNYSGLAFARTTGWRRFLELYYSLTLQRSW